MSSTSGYPRTKVVVSLMAFTSSLVLACAGTPAERDDGNSSQGALTNAAASISRCPDDGSDSACPAGKFKVVCTDGSASVASDEDVRADRICNGGAPAPAQVDDPFDPASCPGAGVTREQAIALFQPGERQAVYGNYTITFREVDCNPVTGCKAPRLIDAPLYPPQGLVNAYPARKETGVATLGIDAESRIRLFLVSDQTASVEGKRCVASTHCGDPSGGSVSCDPYLKASVGERSCFYYKAYQMDHTFNFSGTVGSTCMRLTAKVASPSGSYTEAVLLARR